MGGESPAQAPVEDAKAEQEVDLPIPETVRPAQDAFGPCPFPDPTEESNQATYDPLLIKNIDVVDPQRREYIENLREGWTADVADQRVFEECRRLLVLKTSGLLDEYHSGVDSLNSELNAAGSMFIVDDVDETGIAVKNETGTLTIRAPWPGPAPRGARAPRNPYPRGYMPPYKRPK